MIKTPNNKIIALNQERVMADEEFIVSKTDLKGNITYANRVFMEIARYSEEQLLNKNHNLVRHPDMPKGVFKFLWQTLKKGDEFFGFVKNLCSDGCYYWVFANVTPEYDQDNKVCGYFSVRRKPPASAIKIIAPLYQQMLQVEQEASSDKIAEEQSIKLLQQQLLKLDTNYQDLVIKLFNSKD